jgi:hypothetical protein
MACHHVRSLSTSRPRCSGPGSIGLHVVPRPGRPCRTGRVVLQLANRGVVGVGDAHDLVPSDLGVDQGGVDDLVVPERGGVVVHVLVALRVEQGALSKPATQQQGLRLIVAVRVVQAHHPLLVQGLVPQVQVVLDPLRDGGILDTGRLGHLDHVGVAGDEAGDLLDQDLGVGQDDRVRGVAGAGVGLGQLEQLLVAPERRCAAPTCSRPGRPRCAAPRPAPRPIASRAHCATYPCRGTGRRTWCPSSVRSGP